MLLCIETDTQNKYMLTRESILFVLTSSKTYENFSPEFTNVDMIRWAAEIADGMEFLASKSVNPQKTNLR